MPPNTRRPAGFLKRLTTVTVHTSRRGAHAHATAAPARQQRSSSGPTQSTAQSTARAQQQQAADGPASEQRPRSNGERRPPSVQGEEGGRENLKATSTKCELDEVKRNGGLGRTGVAKRWSPKMSQNWTVVEKPHNRTNRNILRAEAARSLCAPNARRA